VQILIRYLGEIALLALAMVSGTMAFIVAFFLYLQRRDPLFRSFALLSLALALFGLTDSAASVLSSGGLAGRFEFALRCLGALYFVSAGWLVLALSNFSRDALKRELPRLWRWLTPLPLAVGLGFAALGVAAPGLLTVPAMAWCARAYLLLLLLAVVGNGIFLIRSWSLLRDRLFRGMVAGSGLLLVAFLPLELLNFAGLLDVPAFLWFLLVWNVLALVVAARTFFRRRGADQPAEGLFSPGQLLALGERFSLSGREREIAGLHAQGYSSKEIGEKLFIAPKTARNHISNIYGKTNVGRRRELLSLLRDGGESPGG
jgi:DNA-binding CsgD family transcriptional regulator